jgi:hypothetical protein
MLLKIRHRIALKLYLDSHLLLIGYSLCIAVSCPAGCCPSPRELFMYRSKLASQRAASKELFSRELSPGSYFPENSLYIIASYSLEKRYKREENNIDLVRYDSREYI